MESKNEGFIESENDEQTTILLATSHPKSALRPPMTVDEQLGTWYEAAWHEVCESDPFKHDWVPKPCPF